MCVYRKKANGLVTAQVGDSKWRRKKISSVCVLKREGTVYGSLVTGQGGIDV